MTARGVNKVQKQKCLKTGFAQDRSGWAGRWGRRAGKRPQGMAKRLTFREGRLRLHSLNALPDLKVRRLDSRGEVRWRRP